MAVLAYVRGPNGFRRPVTDDDALWAARMLLGESGRYAWETNEGYAVLWTMLNRWVLTAGILPYMTFGDFIQRYSRAVNPRWLQGGSLDPNPAEESENERRRTVRRTLTWNQLEPRLRKVVYDVLQGRVPAGPYAGLVHFGAPTDRVAAGAIGPVSLPGVPTDSNVFYRMPQTASWTASTVALQSERSFTTVRYAGVGLGVGLVAVVLLLSTQLSSEDQEYVRLHKRTRGRREGW